MTKTKEGIIYSHTEINKKIGELAATHNIQLQAIDTTTILQFCSGNAFKNEKLFHRFCDIAIRTAPEQITT